MSEINPCITLEYLKTTEEDLHFARETAKEALADLANHIASFSNTDGGVICVGITSKGEVEGLNRYRDRINEFKDVIVSGLRQKPYCEIEEIPVVNLKGKEDVILLFHIKPANDFVVRNKNYDVYYREGANTIKLNDNQIINLENKRRRNAEIEKLFSSKNESKEKLEEFRRKSEDLNYIEFETLKKFIKYNSMTLEEVCKLMRRRRETAEKIINKLLSHDLITMEIESEEEPEKVYVVKAI